jgi:flagellar motor switch protein FliM
VNRQLSQQEIDAVFERAQQHVRDATGSVKAIPFDFRRLDRVPKSQLRAIRLLNENLVRNLASSLSAYLRAYVTLNLVSVEQLSYSEFLGGLASPTCLVCLGLKPYEGKGLLELNPAVTFAILETLLGGKGKTAASVQREITDIEQSLLDGFLRILLHDLKQAWGSVADISFTVDSLETEPQFVQVLDPGEAFVSVAMDLRVGETSGMMNFAIPSLVIKMMRARFDRQWTLRRVAPSESDKARVERLVRKSKMDLEPRLSGQRLVLEDLLRLVEGDVLPFDHPVDRALDCLVNGKLKLRGRVVTEGGKRTFLVGEVRAPGD